MTNLPDLFFSFEHAACGLMTTEVNGTICRVNATFCQWLGFSAEDLIGKKKVQELFTVGGRFFHHTHLAPLLQMQGSVAEIQLDLTSRDGVVIPMLINAIRHPHGAERFDEFSFVVATDRKNFERELISARQAAEQSLQSLYQTQRELYESRDILGVAIRSARMGIWSENLQSHEFWWSEDFAQLIGLTAAPADNTREFFYALIHSADRDNFIAALNTASQNKTNYEVQFRIRHANGSWLTMEGRGHAGYSPQGDILSIFGIVIDISERKAAEEQLHELNKQLSISDRRKDEFLATLAHELRNPLAPMRNVLEVMRLKETSDSFLQWSRDIIERHVGQMTHLVDDLMEASRISQGRLQLRKQLIDLREMAQHAIEATRALMQQAQHRFTLVLPEHPLIIDADSTRIVQIVSNLLANAAKYTPQGGAVTLRLYQDGSDAVISVCDSGIGIAKDQLANVFAMFSQLTPALERAQGGLGIGLSLVEGLVSLHGGTVAARSEGVNTGSEFIVRLPMATAPVEILQPVATPEVSRATSKRILVIDDNVDAAESLVLLLEFSGHILCCAHTGAAGLAAAADFVPDVILLDIGLPDMNGYEVARRVRQQPWGTDVLLIAATGWGQEKDKMLSAAAGFDKHLTKPIDFQKLKLALQ